MTEQKKVNFDLDVETRQEGNSQGKDANGGSNASQGGNGKRKTWAEIRAEKKKDKESEKKKTEEKKKGFKGATDELAGKIFYYGKDMAARCLTSREAFLDYAGTTYSASEKISLKKGKMTIIGVKQPKKDYTKAQFDALPPFEQEEWKQDVKRYKDKEARVQSNLSSLFSVLWGQMTTNLCNKAKANPDFESIDDTQDCIRLLQLVKLICNSSTVISHFPSRMVDHVYGTLLLSGNNMSLADYYEQFAEKVKVGKVAGVNFATQGLMDWMAKEMDMKGEQEIQKQLGSLYEGQVEDEEDEEGNKLSPTERLTKTLQQIDDQEKLERALDQLQNVANEQFFALVFLRQCGDKYKELRRELQNDFVKGTDHIPKTIEEAYTLVETYELQAKAKTTNTKTTKKENGDAENTNPNTRGKVPSHTFNHRK